MRSTAIPALLLACILSGANGAVSPLRGQSAEDPPPPWALRHPPGPPPVAGLIIPAVRVPGEAPAIDGSLDDEAWASAPMVGGFVQMEPNEGEPATEETEVRVLYGDDALFVAFRAFDSAPDSIAAQLTRRDTDSYSDLVHLLVDSYHDRRTAFHFAVNPAGVKADLYRFDDTEEDASWDAVWEAATRVDDVGWTAEFRIPYSQLRFGDHDHQTWGINFAREIARRNEVSTWAPIRQDDAAVVSRSGELQGLTGIGTPTRMELRPFTLARLTDAPGDEADPFYRPHDFFPSAGLDLKYGVTNDLTLDVTVNPDFGQVEADPAQVNLSAYETFYPEQRPFFIEGASIYRFGIGIGGGDMGSESLFYSRRIGRPPQGEPGLQGGYVDSPDLTTILGAWKLSGKTRGGWSIGLLQALTAQEEARVRDPDGTRRKEAVEPFSNYGVARVQKDFREGRSAVGFIGTATNRERDVAEQILLRSGGYTGGFDVRHRFGRDDRFALSGYILGSHVRGSEEAIARTQRSPARYYQRPDADHVELDPTRTSLSGWAANAEFMKVGEGFWRWGTTATAKSPGFEPNDLGYQREADLVVHALFLGYRHYTPSRHLREWNLDTNAWHAWSFGGERLSTAGNLNGSLTLPSYWGGHAGIEREGEAFSNSTLRGGPLLRREARTRGWFGAFSDSRRAVYGSLNNHWSRGSDSDSWSWNTSVNVGWRPSGRMSLRAGPFVNRTVDDLQWVERVRTDADHYVFGELDQKTVGMTARFDFTFKPDLTLQLYAQPFVSTGAYREFKEIVSPRADRYRDRYAPLDPILQEGRYRVDLDGDGGLESFRRPDFNFKQFRSNLVLRWEYRPGSLLYLVWSQGRDHTGRDGGLSLGDDLDDLFSSEAENIFLVKLSYWITP